MATDNTNQTWLERNQKTLFIAGIALVAILLFVPDIYLRKYVPFVK